MGVSPFAAVYPASRRVRIYLLIDSGGTLVVARAYQRVEIEETITAGLGVISLTSRPQYASS
jgi:hypothetical protein